MRRLNSLKVPKNLKETLCNFLTIILFQNIKKMKEGGSRKAGEVS